MSIETLIPGEKYLIITWPQGGKGKRRKETFYGSKEQAIKHHAETCRTPHLRSVTNPRIRQLWPDFLRFFKNDRLPSTVKSVITSFDLHLIPFFGDKPISQLTPTVIEQFKEKRLSEGVKKRTISKELSYFQGLIKWAVEQGHAHQPTWKIKLFPAKHTKPPLPVIPTPDEIQAIYENLWTEDSKGIFLLIYDGGLRVSEACTIQGKNVNLGQGYILVTGKGGKERIVPITTPRLREELERRVRKMKDGYLYINPDTGRPYTMIRRALTGAAKRAGVQKRVYHHLFRHSFGTHSVESGVDLAALQWMMGHSTIRTTQGYVHIGAEYVKEQAKKFAGKIARVKTSRRRHPTQKGRKQAALKHPEPCP